jgi:hypothetical protein
MISFFRNIRQKLLQQNRITRYLAYAIGEIFLVVIGILIALQVNNWNENRKDRIREQEILIQLESEFQSNLDQLDEKIEIRNLLVQSSMKLIEIIDSQSPVSPDTVIYYTSKTMIAPTFDPITNDLISAGKLQLLTNTRLKNLLSLWTSEVLQVTEDELSWRRIMNDQYFPFLIKSSSLRNLLSGYWNTNQINNILLDKQKQVGFSIPTNNELEKISELLEEDDFEDYLADCASWNTIINSQSETLRERIVEILTLIHEDLNRNQ